MPKEFKQLRVKKLQMFPFLPAEEPLFFHGFVTFLPSLSCGKSKLGYRCAWGGTSPNTRSTLNPIHFIEMAASWALFNDASFSRPVSYTLLFNGSSEQGRWGNCFNELIPRKHCLLFLEQGSSHLRSMARGMRVVDRKYLERGREHREQP